ncbi:ATPase [Hansschlegelia plantiphila]|uniref:P-type ATPase n=1 Tax=Hansschlegelia plantiphila TaxID=374655 RepID=UPI0022F24641|nr:ATPase [Hansschlegelia plantiphila]
MSIWSEDLFHETRRPQLRDFLDRAFSVPDVRAVEVRRSNAFARVRYAASRDAPSIWRRLSRALRGDDTAPGLDGGTLAQPRHASGLFLDAPSAWPLRVIRVGDELSTWRVRMEADDQIRFAHPALRGRRDVVFRLEEELAGLSGIEDFRASVLTAGASIRFDSRLQTPARLARELERAWPKVLSGLEGPPSRRRLYVAGALLGLAAVGQTVAPALRPVAVAGVALFGAPNVILAARQLRHGQIGLPALYSTGLAFMLVSGMPLGGTIITTFMQFWPEFARRTIVERQRRLFAAHRRRPSWARIPHPDGLSVEIHVDDLRPGVLVIVRRGERSPVDGVVTAGAAAVADVLATGSTQASNVAVGGAVHAGSLVVAGELTIRVERAGEATAAAHISRALPHAGFSGLPSSARAELIANRNAKPALALAALSLITTRTLRPSQAIIRPDYATAPRLSAQLAALTGFVEALDRGLLLRKPGALDQIADIDVFVFDESVGLGRDAETSAGVTAAAGVDVVSALRKQNPHARFVLLSGGAETKAKRGAESVGVDLAFGDLDDNGKADAIRGLGRRAVWIGDGSAPGAAAAMSSSAVSVSIAGFASAPDDRADVLVLHGGLNGLLELRDVGRNHRATLASDYRNVYAFNLLGVAGALFARFGGLQAGLVSNFGTALLYARHARRLRQLTAEHDARNALLLTAVNAGAGSGPSART